MTFTVLIYELLKDYNILLKFILYVRICEHVAHITGTMSFVHSVTIKTKLDAVSLCCKRLCFKTANIKIYPQSLITEAIAITFISVERPVINVKSSFCA